MLLGLKYQIKTESLTPELYPRGILTEALSVLFGKGAADVTWSYIILGSIIRLIAGKKSKTSEEFEPDVEDHEDEG